jgi:molybdopterin-biosynthesis enzyme MoeA-like protein
VKRWKLQCAELYRDPVGQKLVSNRFGWDPGLAVRCYKLRTLFFLGFPDEAKRVSELVQAPAESQPCLHSRNVHPSYRGMA